MKSIYFSMRLTGNDVDKIDPLDIWKSLDERYDVELMSFHKELYES